MKKSFGLLSAIILSGIVSFSATSLAGPNAPFIAGIEPDRRPQGAPTINSLARDAGWYAEALHGVSKPYPQTLRFLEDQGNWFTPFNRPGMTGPYDIRRWHGGK